MTGVSFDCRKLGLTEGRSAKRWVDYSMFGHQIVCHEVQNYNAASTANAGAPSFYLCVPAHVTWPVSFSIICTLMFLLAA